MTGLLISRSWLERYGSRLDATAAALGLDIDCVHAPEEPAARLSAEDCSRIEIAFFTRELNPDLARPFFAAIHGAPNLRWLHVYNTGVDSPVYPRLLERGIHVSTSSGTTAKPVAVTAIAGLLMLARGFPAWMNRQRQHVWEKSPLDGQPRDLDGQTAVIIGLGPIGSEIARLARALGMHVIGVRRSPARDGDEVDELSHPDGIGAVLPRADWLVIAAPLTPETRGMIGARELALLPRGARLVNIARGEIVDESALADALRAGHLGGAYLDVFAAEPLPAESPLWDLPNVVVSPHDAGASSGNEDRAAALFLLNLESWARGAALVNDIAGVAGAPPPTS